MNNNVFKDLRYKIFKSGNPLFFYIGINTIIFLVVSLVAVVAFLGGNTFNVSLFVRDYLGLPAALSAFPGRFYTAFTYMFLHDGLLHLAFNMLGLFWFGNIFMNFLKARQFHFIYLAGGFGGAFLYLLALNVFPVFQNSLSGATLIGSSAAVMAIIVAAATLVPNYTIMLMFIGPVKIKYLALVYFVLDVLGITSLNAGGSIAHIGGAIIGFAAIKNLQKGRDWSKIFERKPKLKVVRNDAPVKKAPFTGVSQHEIDQILDKISKSGYDKLTAAEKEKLFKASKN